MTHEAGMEAAQEKIWVVTHGEYSIDSDGAQKVIKAYLTASGAVIVPIDMTDEMKAKLNRYFNEPSGSEWGAYVFQRFLKSIPDPFKRQP